MRAYLEPALGTLKLHELGRQTVQALVDRLRADGLKASTVHNKLDPCGCSTGVSSMTGWW